MHPPFKDAYSPYHSGLTPEGVFDEFLQILEDTFSNMTDTTRGPLPEGDLPTPVPTLGSENDNTSHAQSIDRNTSESSDSASESPTRDLSDNCPYDVVRTGQRVRPPEKRNRLLIKSLTLM